MYGYESTVSKARMYNRLRPCSDRSSVLGIEKERLVGINKMLNHDWRRRIKVNPNENEVYEHMLKTWWHKVTYPKEYEPGKSPGESKRVSHVKEAEPLSTADVSILNG